MSTAEQAPQLIAPHPLVLELAEQLPPRSRVVDLGAGESRNGIHLARLGHEVTAIELDFEYAAAGQAHAKSLGVTALNVVCGDVKKLPLKGEFDTAISTAVLQMLSNKENVYDALEGMTQLTAKGGLNALSVYVGTPEDRADRSRKNVLNYAPGYYIFAPGELADFYRQKGWQVRQEAIGHQYLGTAKELNGVSAQDFVLAYNTGR